MRSALPVLLITVLLAACVTEQERLPEASGGQGEVLVVMPKGHWEGVPGATVRSLLEQPIDGLPQREARYKVAQCAPDAFGSLLKAHHSVLYASIGGKVDTVAVQLLRDRNAHGQLMVLVSAHDPGTWANMLQRQAGEVNATIEEHQRERVAQRLKRERDAALVSSIRSQHGISVDIPGGYTVKQQAPGFTWLQRDRIVSGSGLEHNVVEGVLIHRHAYMSDSTFHVPFLVDQRDSVTKTHVPGPDPGSYMMVQRNFEQLDLMPNGRNTTLNGQYAYVMHGLFGMHGAKMGGPFVSLTTVDTARNELITVEGFVYAPQFDKREYMRELEAIVFSLRVGAEASR
jgi:hypothetical protein